ncbi:EAL domain-containing protein, partial [Halobellus sp. Atlit-31R]
ETGSEIAHYQARLHDRTKDSLAILSGLRGALERRELLLHYQPKVCLRSGVVRGVEALMRWDHRERGLIGPGVFIARAEQSTLIHALTAFALEQALCQAVRWQSGGIDMPVAVNISSRNLAHPDFARQILDTLERCGAAPRLLELEVTESSLMTDVGRTTAELQLLARYGIKTAIDDFGTGYSSLSYLHRFPIHTVKIDQSFVKEIHEEGGHYPVILAIISIARGLGLNLIAEGVETEEQARYLRANGCMTMQGYLYYR